MDSGRSFEQNKAKRSLVESGRLQLQSSVQHAANSLQQFIVTNLRANFQVSILTNTGDIPLSLPPETSAQISEIIQQFSHK